MSGRATALALALIAFPLAAQEPPQPQGAAPGASQSVDEISRKLADPGAALVSLPFQYNYLGDAGPGGDYNNQVLKVQPVIPFVNAHSKFILRPILPVLNSEFPQDKSGIGDLVVQGYYIPLRPGSTTEFGFGPIVQFDTASADTLGSGKYSLGPAFLAVHKTAHWTLGGLFNHLVSVAGDDDRADVSITNLQPIVTRSLGHGWSASFSPEISYDWKASSGNAWTLPVGATVSKVVMFGQHPVSFATGGYYNVDRPDDASRWTARFQVTLVFPE